MNLRRLGRLIGFFFTQPIKLSHFAFLRPRLRRRKDSFAELDRGADFEATRMIDRANGADVVDVWRRSHGALMSASSPSTPCLPNCAMNSGSARATLKP